jgi:hypothetical protein
LVWHLKAMGDRLEKPGTERLTLTGTLTRTNDPQTQAIVAVLEFPDRLRLTIQKGAENRVITFDKEQPKAAANSLNTADGDVVETLVYDTAEHFFATQMQGMATRFWVPVSAWRTVRRANTTGRIATSTRWQIE